MDAVSAAPLPIAPTLVKKPRIQTVEFWRFALTVLVAVYHFEIYFTQRTLIPAGSGAVEFFFILAGFTMAMSADSRAKRRTATSPVTVKEAHAEALSFVVKKLKVIVPIVLVCVILACFVYPMSVTPVVETPAAPAYDPWAGFGGFGGFGGGFGYGGYGTYTPPPAPVPATEFDRISAFMNSEWELLLMVGTPFGFNNGSAPNVPLWFLTALLVVGYLYTFAITIKRDIVLFLAPAIGILFYIFFTLNSTMLIDHAAAMGFFNAGTVHAIAEMSFGIALYTLFTYVKAKNLGIVWKAILSLLEIYAIYRLFSLTFGDAVGFGNFRKIPYLMAVIFFGFYNSTWIAQILNRKVFRFLGDLSLIMYIAHYNLIPVFLKIAQRFTGKGWGLFTWLFGTANINGGIVTGEITAKFAISFVIFVMLVSAAIKFVIFLIGKIYQAGKKAIELGEEPETP
ncbi:MAG: acyltransferase family protein [Oscillospiraceae bacterium]|jgi:peptidoglycan/LPS O-acetylase OafA/YrhL|nr:acyltransferase family protein [Oscillospiraceae bacterium]